MLPETPVVPVGPENKFEPGDPDRGQPTFFDTRVHRKEFSVRVPADWGKKELVWNLTVAGVTEKAVAWLQPEWEIDPIYQGKARNEESLKNKPPVSTVASEATASVAAPARLLQTARSLSRSEGAVGLAEAGSSAALQATPAAASAGS